MKCISAKCTLTDPYRAGLDIGTALSAITPEIVLLFASISYDPDFTDFFEALYEGLGSTSVLIFGGTGDGVYETSGAENYGVSALGINSEGSVSWSITHATGVAADSFGAARECARKSLEKNSSPGCFRVVLADGALADGNAVVNGISTEITAPFFGGLTGDDREFTRSKLFLNGREFEDTVAMLSGCGDIRFAVHAASGWTPIGNVGVVEEIKGCEIFTISGLPARDFMARETGKPLGESDLGIVPLAAYQADSAEHFFLRTPSQINPENGSVTTFGSVESGSVVRVCTATHSDVLRGVSDTLDGLQSGSPGFTPSAAIIISCAGRKWLMADRGEKELETFQQKLGTSLPLVGFPSFGEISPFRNHDGGYTPVSFHNVTFVACLIG